MLSKSLRKIFYTLRQDSGPARWLADAIALGFMYGVKLTGIKPPYDLTPLTLVSHSHRFIYIGIPKTATRSLRDALCHENSPVQDVELAETKTAFRRILRDNPAYFTFSFVRNPYARALSCYNSKIGHPSLSLLKRARIMSFYNNLGPEMTFADFARWLNTQEGQDDCADRHWLSQHRFLYDVLYDGERCICDFIGYHERLETDLQAVMDRLGLEVPELPQSGWISGADAYHKHYDDETRDLITKRYARDLELFGYGF